MNPRLPNTPDPDSEPATGAADALRQIARSEAIKAYIQQDRPLHDALLGAALRYIAGETLESAVPIARRINESGHAVTIDFLGESSRDADRSRAAATEFHRIIDAIRRHGIRGSVSLDLSDPARCPERCLELMISAEGAERTDDVLAMYERLTKRYPNVGITLQAYLNRTPRDIERALAHPGRIRIVKGAFGEASRTILPRGDELNARYIALVERAIAAGHSLSIATHDSVLLDHLSSRVPVGMPGVEFEMLYGIQEGRLARQRERGFPTRVYLPYGEEWFLYVSHRLAEYPPNIYRAVSDAVAHAHPGHGG
jgi:proline dehydrogenase